jgi:hypothetical protein
MHTVKDVRHQHTALAARETLVPKGDHKHAPAHRFGAMAAVRRWLPMAVLLTVILGAGISATVVFSVYTSHARVVSRRREFAGVTNSLVQHFNTSLADAVGSLATMVAVMNLYPNTTFQGFAQVAKALRAASRMDAMEYVRRVPHAERRLWEELISAAVGQPIQFYSVRALSSSLRGARGV